MKAITIRQPWASLIALGEKQFETRSWATRHRGSIAIHAGKAIDKRAWIHPEIHDILRKHGILTINDLPIGAVIATASLTACWSIGESDEGGIPVLHHDASGESRGIGPLEKTFGDYSCGRKAWELVNVRRLPVPIVVRGQQGLWNVFKINDC